MDCIIGKINLEGTYKNDIKVDSESYDDGFLSVAVNRTSNFKFDSLKLFYNSETDILSSALGYFTNLDEIKSRYSINKNNDVEIIEELFRLSGLRFLNEIDGHFIIFIYDRGKGISYVLQPEHGAILPIYFVQETKTFIFSTSLKLLLKKSTIKREIDIKAARKFLYYQHIIPDETTLIKGIEKLPPQSYLFIDREHKKVQRKQYITDRLEISKTEAKTNFIDYIKSNIKNIYAGLAEEQPTITLTRGYDSNLTLYLLRQITEERINAITVNGGKEYNEVPSVKKIISNYRNVELFTDDFNKELILSLPDLVWRYEGYIFEAGMFLRYLICRLLDDLNIRAAFFGAGSNEIISLEKKSTFYSKINDLSTTFRNIAKSTIIGNIYYKTIGSNLPEDKLRREFHTDSPKVKYNIPFDYILKMHDILLNSFNIRGVYTFISKEIISAAIMLRDINLEKNFFKESVRKTIEPKIAEQLAQSDIVSDTKSIYSFSKEILLNVFEKKIVLKLLKPDQINMIKNNPEEYHVFISQLVYLHLFDKLFLSGEYDKYFDKSSISFKLDNIM